VTFFNTSPFFLGKMEKSYPTLTLCFLPHPVINSNKLSSNNIAAILKNRLHNVYPLHELFTFLALLPQTT